MTDKVQKIRKEVARIQLYSQSEVLKQILDFIDSLQEEPVSEELEEVAKYYIPDESYHMTIESKEEGSGENVYDYVQMLDMFKAGAKWQKENLWKPADGDDLPEIDREVIVLTQPYPLEKSEYEVRFAHRPNPDGWDGKSITTGKVEHYTPETYDKGSWNIPDVKYWLDVDLPKEIEL